MFSRILFVILATGLWMGQLRAATELILSSSSVSVQAGDTLGIEVIVNSDALIMALQFDLDLPPALTYVPGSAALSDRAGGHQVQADMVSEKRLRVIVYSNDLSTLAGTTGKVLSLKFAVLARPGTHLLMAVDPMLLVSSGQPVPTNVTGTSFTVLAPDLRVPQEHLDFGRVRLNQDRSVSVTVFNNGNAGLQLHRVSTSDSSFTVSAFSPGVIAPGEQMDFSVNFNPARKGNYSAYLLITSSDPNRPEFRLPMKAEAYAFNALYIFPDLPARHDTVTIEVSVQTQEPVVALELGLETGKDFEYVPGSATLLHLPTDHVLRADTAQQSVRFVCYSPTNSPFPGGGEKVFAFRINLMGGPGSFLLIPNQAILATAGGENVLSNIYPGTIHRKAPVLSVERREIDFGRVAVGDTAAKELIVANQGTDTLTLLDFRSNRREFAIQETPPLLIPPSDRAALHVVFTPGTPGEFTGTIQIQSNDGASPALAVSTRGQGVYENVLRLVDTAASPEKMAWLAVDLRNQSDIVALQFDLLLPPSFTMVSDSIQFTERRTDHTWTQQAMGEGRHRILAYSPSLQAFAGDSGAVLLIPIRVGSQTGRFDLHIEHAILSDPAGKNVLSEVVDGSVQVQPESTAMTFSYDAGWNLLSVPLQTESRSVKILFPQAEGQALRFTQGYVATAEIEPGPGFWLRFPTASQSSLQGQPLLEHTITLQPGWNLIGSIAVPVGVDEVLGGPIQEIQSLVYGYRGGYQPVDILQPGQGYWIYAPTERQLHLRAGTPGATSSPAAGSVAGLASTLLEKLNSLVFVDADDHRMVLFFGLRDSLHLDAAVFRLPPAPPEGAFDVRFDTDRFVATVPAVLPSPEERTVQWSAARFPITVKWNVRRETVQYTLKGAAGTSLPEITLSGIDSLVLDDGSINRLVLRFRPTGVSAVDVQSAVPRTISLFQNHPNPFIQHTSVRFELTQPSHVQLVLYDINGRQIRRLVDREYIPGEYRLRLAVDDLPAGVYFLELTARGERQVLKLLRIR